MAKQTIEIEVDVPEGFEATGECRLPERGDFYLSGSGATTASYDYTDIVSPILRRVEPVRESLWGWICCVNESLERARAMKYGCPVVRADYEDGKLVSVAMEPAEGEG